MEVLSHSCLATINITTSFPTSNLFQYKKFISFTNSSRAYTKHIFNDPLSFYCSFPSNSSFDSSKYSKISAFTRSNSTAPCSTENAHWVVILDKPPEGIQSEDKIMNYYVSTLQRALGSEKDARKCIYNASCDNQFWFCCYIDEGTSRFLASLPGVLSVKPDEEVSFVGKGAYSTSNLEAKFVSKSPNGSTWLFPEGSKHWLVCVDKPSVGVSSKAQAVDFYVSILNKVLGNEKDAQMCIYHVSWQSNFWFCCILDEESAQQLAAVPGVLSVQLDEDFESKSKDYGGGRLSNGPVSTQTTEISRSKLFITGLSFYTSEKTLRAAFEPFGELVEVKVIMDKISKRSKGYAFVEYTTEEAATTALQEMNGKIINGWMIVVDRAKSEPTYSRDHSRSKSLQRYFM